MSLSGTGIQDLARRTARGLDAVSEGYPFTDSLLVFKVCGRVFLVVTEVPDDPLVTVKIDPAFAEDLVRQHESITLGRYFDKRHWVTIAPGSGITAALVESLVQDSYDTVVDSLPRRDRERIDRLRGR